MVIENIFEIVIKFRSQVNSDSLVMNESTNNYEHPLFDSIVNTYLDFKKRAMFLFKSINFFFIDFILFYKTN
jgi:hypothetical protein